MSGRCFLTVLMELEQGGTDRDHQTDISTPDFPGLVPLPSGGFRGPRLSPDTHPHLRLETAMTSVPEVQPGDMVFWHCDVVHSVEEEHKGDEDSAGTSFFF